MKGLRIILAGFLLSAWSTSKADDYRYLTVNTSGSETSYEVNGIDRITFDATKMILWKNEGEKLGELPLESLDKMAFTTSASGIYSIEASSKIRLRNGTLIVDAKRGSLITLYNIGGVAIREVVASADETSLNLSGLTKGIYIIKVNDNARKFMNK